MLLFLRVTIQTFVLLPYRVAAYFLNELYPVYAFVGTATLCAIVIGLGARLLSRAVAELLFGSGEGEKGALSDEMKAPESKRKRSKRRVTVKEEDPEDDKLGKVGIIYYWYVTSPTLHTNIYMMRDILFPRCHI